MSRPSALRETLNIPPCHSLEVLSVLASGDCFYDCIHELLTRHEEELAPLFEGTSIPPLLRSSNNNQSAPGSEGVNTDASDGVAIPSSQSMRNYVADQLTSEQLDLYKMYATAGLDEYNFSTELTLEGLKLFARKSGRSNGPGKCFWADEFALRITSDGLHMTLLIIDDQATRGGAGGRKRRRNDNRDTSTSRDNRFVSIGNYPRAVILHRSRRQHYNAVVIDNHPVIKLEQLPQNVRSLWSVETSANNEAKSDDQSKMDLDKGNTVSASEEKECKLDEKQSPSSEKTYTKEHTSNNPAQNISEATTNHTTNSLPASSKQLQLGNFYCGCAGFSSSSWVGNFYPKSIVGHNSDRQLDHYQQHFRAVEINSTFYGIPTESTVKKWKSIFAKSFKVVMKAPKGLTHEQSKLDCSVLATFLSWMQPLDDSLVGILIQCPRTLSVTVTQLKEIKSILENEGSWYKGYLAFEFRNEATYYDKPLRAFMKENNFPLVVHPNSLGRSTIGTSTSGRGNANLHEYLPEQLSEVASAIDTISSIIYLRLHGFNDEHSGEYSVDQLKEIAQQIHHWRELGLDIYCFFLNDLEPRKSALTKQKSASQPWDKWCAMPKNAKQLECLVYELSNETTPDAQKKPKSTLLNFFCKK